MLNIQSQRNANVFQTLLIAFKETERKRERILGLHHLYEEMEKHKIQIVRDDKIPSLRDKAGDFLTGVLLLTDREELLKEAWQQRIAAAGYEEVGKPLKFCSNSCYILQRLDEIDFSDLEKIYKRCHEEPLEITETKNLRIREICREDAENLYNMGLDKDIKKSVFTCCNSIEEQKIWIRDYIKNVYPFYNYGVWIMEEKCTNEFVGQISLIEKEENAKNYLELGYAIIKEKRRLGYAFEGSKGVIKYALEELENGLLTEFRIYMRPDNIASKRTALKLGFTQTESIHEKLNCYIWMGGIYYNSN